MSAASFSGVITPKFTLDSQTEIALLSVKAGGKATNLARLSQKGFPVPAWFAVTADCFETFLVENNLKAMLKPNGDFKQLSLDVEAAFIAAKIPAALQTEIEGRLKALGLESSFLAVRSSGLDEDSAENSFAGQFSSFLFQKGWEQVADSLKRCWASGFSERVLNYRVERGIQLSDIKIGVVIQQMANATSAGVVFSRHPLKVLDRDKVLVSSVWGLGEGLVSGELESDDFEVSRASREVTKNVPTKSHALRQSPTGGLVKEELAAADCKTASLTDEQAREVAQMSVRLEDALGAPQDAEWVYENSRLLLVQTRPITNLPPAVFYDVKVNGNEPILWDNSNIIESYSGVTSPLTFSFASRAYNQVYIQFCELMGVPQEMVDANSKMFRNMLGLIRGRIYYHLLNWYQFILMLPGGASNKGFMDTMMGVKGQLAPEMKGIFDLVKAPPKYSWWAKIALTSATIWRFIRIDTIIKEFRLHFDAVYEKARHEKLDDWSLPRLNDHFHYLDDQLLKRWKAPIINDYLCMLFFGLLKKLTGEWVADAKTADSLQNDLLCGEGGLDSTEPTKCLMRIAAALDKGDKTVREWLVSTPSEKIWEYLQGAGRTSDFGVGFHDFLDKFGFRSINELKLEEPDLHDDPTFVISSIVSYVRTGSYAIGDMETRERQIRAAAEGKVKAKLSGPRLLLYWWVLKQARRAVKNRENLRFARTKIFGVSRHLFRAMGRKLTALNVLGGEHDIFYLTVEEIGAYIEGRALTGSLKALVADRKIEFQIYRDTPPPPDRFISLGAAGVSMNHMNILAEGDLLRALSESDDPNILIGTPCSPGIIEGIVRVVNNVKDAEGINGEILVTARTDPGWVPLYPSCSGLLIERGSLLSHSAVVARELGLPTIVGINGGLMTKLKTGQRVRIDAGKGEVHILGV